MELRAAREASGKTQARVAKEVGISETHYQNIEYDKHESGVKTAIAIADALGIKTLEEFKALFGAATPDSKKEPDGNRA